MTSLSIDRLNSLIDQPYVTDIPTRLVSWLKSKLISYRARKARIQSLRYLRGLDPATLEDIGVDVQALNSPIAAVVRANPYIIAIATATGTRLVAF